MLTFFFRDVTNSFQPSCEQIVPAIFQGPKRYIFYVHPLPRLLRSKPDICGPFKSIFFLFSTQKKQVTYVQIRLGVKRTQDFLSLLPRKFSVCCPGSSQFIAWFSFGGVAWLWRWSGLWPTFGRSSTSLFTDGSSDQLIWVGRLWWGNDC